MPTWFVPTMYSTVHGVQVYLSGPPVLLSGSTIGHIAVWNLEERKLASQMRSVHSQPVQGRVGSQRQVNLCRESETVQGRAGVRDSSR